MIMMFLSDKIWLWILSKDQTTNSKVYFTFRKGFCKKAFLFLQIINPKESGIPCHFIQRIGLRYADKADVEDKECLPESMEVSYSKGTHCWSD